MQNMRIHNQLCVLKVTKILNISLILCSTPHAKICVAEKKGSEYSTKEVKE